MANLSELFGKELSQPLVDLYWGALNDLAIEQVESAARVLIKRSKHFPKPAEFHSILDEQKESSRIPRGHIELPPPDRKWLAAVNQLFLRYLQKRRIDEGFTGDINLAARRIECLSLVDFFEALDLDNDPAANKAELKIRFDRAMARVPDALGVAA